MRIFASSPWVLKQVFGFFGQSGQIVSLVGGGGKTTLMYFMAATCAKEGKKVLLTTTTNLFLPNKAYYATSEAEVEALWAEGKIAIIGTPLPGKGKLGAPEPAFLDRMLEKCDAAFIEADGSKRMPCKVPRDGEPVIHPKTDVVIAVFGLSALGQPLKNVCFRKELAMEHLDVEENHILTEEDAAKLLSAPWGARKDVGDRKFCVVLNQCDDGKRRRAANEIAGFLALENVAQVVMTAFDPEDRVKYDRMSQGIW